MEFRTSGKSLSQGEYLSSFFDKNRLEENRLVLQSDGNFVIYHLSNGGQSSQAVWASKTNGRAVRATMQADGNLVLFHSLGVSSWSSGTNKTSNEGASLILQDNGNAVICAKDGRNIWATGTRRLMPGNLSLISEKADPYKYDKKNNEKSWWNTETVVSFDNPNPNIQAKTTNHYFALS